MNDLLSKLLGKRGIRIDELSKEEAVDFDRWGKILSTKTVTIADLKEYLAHQLSLTEDQLDDMHNSELLVERLNILRSIYRKMIKFIDSPQIERENLEKHLKQLIENS